MKNRILAALVALIATASIAEAQHRDAPKEFFVRPHTANDVTAARDTIDDKRMAKRLGMVKDTKAVADTFFYVVGTAIDTSFMYRMGDSMTLHVFPDDTSASDDSAAVRIDMFVAARDQYDGSSKVPPEYADFTATAAWTDSVTSQTSKSLRVINSTLPFGSWVYFTITGLAGNTLTGAAAVKIKGSWAWSDNN